MTHGATEQPLSITEAVAFARKTLDSTDPTDGYIAADILAQFVIAKFGVPIVDQPAPTQNARRPSWELVIEDMEKIFVRGSDPKERTEVAARTEEVLNLVLTDMRERDQVGRARYGTPLQADNGRRHLVDAYQEALDAAVYLRTWLVEENVSILSDAPPDSQVKQMVALLYFETIQRLPMLRELIDWGH